MKLDELLRRHDVCFFCGYTIGIAGQTKCPECGKGRPTAAEVARLRRPVKIGRFLVVLTLVALVGLIGWRAYYAYKSGKGSMAVGVLECGMTTVLVLALLSPWWNMVQHARLLFCDRGRRLFVAAYPLLVLGILGAAGAWVVGGTLFRNTVP